MFGRLLAAHPDASQIGVDAWPWRSPQSFVHASERVGALGRKRAERETAGGHGPQLRNGGHGFQAHSCLGVDIDLGSAHVCEHRSHHCSGCGAGSGPRDASLLPSTAGLDDPLDDVLPCDADRDADLTLYCLVRCLRVGIKQSVPVGDAAPRTAASGGVGFEQAKIGQEPQGMSAAAKRERPVAAWVAATVASVPHSSTSATQNAVGDHRFTRLGCDGRPGRDTMTEPTAISAAPVSSTQPVPTSDNTLLAPGDRQRPTTMSGSGLRDSSSWMLRNRPSPTHATSSCCPPSLTIKRVRRGMIFTSALRGSASMSARAARSPPPDAAPAVSSMSLSEYFTKSLYFTVTLKYFILLNINRVSDLAVNN